MKTILSSVLCAVSLLSVSNTVLNAAESLGFLSKGVTTLTISGTVYPDTPEKTYLYSDPQSIVIENGALPVDATVELTTLIINVGESFTAYQINIILGSYLTVGPFLCAKQNGSNHIIKLPEGYTSLDTGDTVFTVESPALSIDISGLNFQDTSENLTPTLALSGNDTKHSPIQGAVFRGNKVALISADNREKEYDLSLGGVSKESLKEFSRKIANAARDVKLNLSVTPEGKVALLLEVD